MTSAAPSAGSGREPVDPVSAEDLDIELEVARADPRFKDRTASYEEPPNTRLRSSTTRPSGNRKRHR